MPDTRRDIAQFGNGDHWYYDGWAGIGPHFIDTWFMAEGTGPGAGGISGPHRPTAKAAEADIAALITRDAENGTSRRDSWRVVRCSPALRISIEREVRQ